MLTAFGRLSTASLLACLMMSPTFAAGPSGGTVSAGSATITQSAAQTTIKQTSDKAVVNWSNFSIGSGSSVRFEQPSASSIALNRVTGRQASVIQGALQANGQVWVLNPNGVLIAPGGQVAAGSFLATTRSLTDQQFMAGNYAFTDGGVPGASVVNQGSIILADGGYAVLAGEAVRNEGYIEANLGQVVLGGAKAFTLDLSGDNTLAFVVTAPVDVTPTDGKAVVDNSGSIQAAGGRVLMTVRAASQVVGQVINTGGVVAATSAQMVNGKIVLDGGTGSVSVVGELNASGKGAGQTGGAIDVNAQKIQVKATAKLDVTGDAGGGKIAIGGGGPNTRTQSFTPAESTTIAAGARLDASALTSGDGGEILAFTSLTNPLALTQVAGSLIARGGAQGGNGGFVETSGYRLDVSGIVVNTIAPKGRVGLWLLDPTNIVISRDSTSTTTDAGCAVTPADLTNCTNVKASDLQNQLALTEITLSAVTSITVDASINWSSDNSLFLETTSAAGRIVINSQIKNTGSASLNLKSNNIKVSAAIELTNGAFSAVPCQSVVCSLTDISDVTIENAGSVRAGSANLDATRVKIDGPIRSSAGSIAIGGLFPGNDVTINSALDAGTSKIIIQTAGGVINLGANLTACQVACEGDSTLTSNIVNVTSAVTQVGQFTITANEPLAKIGAVNIDNAYTVTSGGSLTIMTDTLRLRAALTVGDTLGLNLFAETILWNRAVSVGTGGVASGGPFFIQADTIVWGGGGFSSTDSVSLRSNTEGVGITMTSTGGVGVSLASLNLYVQAPLTWSAFSLTHVGPVWVLAPLVGQAGASLFLPSGLGNPGTSSITLDGTAALSSVFKLNDRDVGSGTYSGVTVTVTNPAGSGGGDTGGGGDGTSVVVTPVTTTTTTTTTAASAAAAKAAADAAAAKAVADAATARAAALSTTTTAVVDQAITQAVATVVASTSAAVFVAPAPPPPATPTTSSASTTTSTDTTTVSSSVSTTTTAATTTTATTATTTTTAATTSTAQSTVATQEFVEPLSVTTLSSTTSTVSDPGDTSAATTSTTSGPAAQTATPASTATAAPAAPSLTPVAVSKDGADAGDFTLQTVKPPAPVTTAKQEARPTERVTTTPVSPGIALQATQKTPTPSGSVLGREISGSGNSSNW